MIDGERHRRCGQCGDWWPDTAEFFHRNKKGDGFRSPCKACIQERRYATNKVATCCVPGCHNPRAATRSGVYRNSRCREHRYYVAVTKRRQLEVQADGA